MKKQLANALLSALLILIADCTADSLVEHSRAAIEGGIFMFDWLKDKAKDTVNDLIDEHPKLKDLKQQGIDYLNPEDKMLREAKKREDDYDDNHYY